MSGKRYLDEYKIEAVKQVTERGHSVKDVAARLGITTHSLYEWKRKFGQPATAMRADSGPERRSAPAQGGGQASDRGARHSKKAAAYFAKG
jgi:transposase